MRKNGIGRLVFVTGLLSLYGLSPALAQCPGDCPVPGGGSGATDCMVEYYGLAATEAEGNRIVRCVDGAVCDRDGTKNGACQFEVNACVNQDDPALPACTVAQIDTYDVRDATSNADLAGLQTKVRAFLPTGESVCSNPQPVTVLLGGTVDAPIAGRVRIQSTGRSVAPAVRDTDRIELICDPQPRPLGRRMFSINKATSPLKADIGILSISAGFFQGFLELEAGTPNENGFASINVLSASDFIFADLREGAFPTNSIVCLRPLVPAQNVGLIACQGQVDFSYLASANHILGVVGEDGFTAEDCTSACGAAGCGRVEGPTAPHPGACNGPINLGSGGHGDSGRGAVAISPDPVTGIGGLTFELSFVNPGRCRGDTATTCTTNAECGEGSVCMQSCADAPAGQTTPLPFFSGPVEVRIQNADGVGGTDRSFKTRGKNFSCANWTMENGPGKIVFGIPQLHGFSISPGAPPGDLITAFELSDK